MRSGELEVGGRNGSESDGRGLAAGSMSAAFVSIREIRGFLFGATVGDGLPLS